MLPRVLEPEVMDTPEEARGYDTMDHTAVNRLFAADFLAIWDGRGPIVDLGTGTAQIPIELCRQSSQCQVIAIDAAEQMLIVARENVARAGLSDRIELRRTDAKSMPFADGSMVAIMSNSIVHHIPDPRQFFAELGRIAATGATILVRDLLRPVDLPTLQALVEVYAGDSTDHQRQMFSESLHAALTLDEVRALVAEIGREPGQVMQTTDRHWTWAVPGRA